MSCAVETVIVPVRGMRCGGCERRVKAAVEEVAGVHRASADLVAEEVEVAVDPALVELEAIRAAIARAGFAAG